MRSAFRTEQKRYLDDLEKRARKAECSRCKAKPGKPCTNHGRPIAGRHWERTNEARRLGFVEGKWYGTAERQRT